MAPTWQAMGMGIALQLVPPKLAWVVTIMCNDCEQQYDFLGIRCLICMSFNTTIKQTTMTGREAAAYLDDLDLTWGTINSNQGNMNGDLEPYLMDHDAL